MIENKVSYTFKEYVSYLYNTRPDRNGLSESIKRIIDKGLFTIFVYPVLGPIPLEKISFFHIRKLFLYFDGNFLTKYTQLALSLSINAIFKKAKENDFINVNQFEEALKNINRSSIDCFLTLEERKMFQKLNYELLYQDGASLFNKPNIASKHEIFSKKLYLFLYHCFIKHKELNNHITNRMDRDEDKSALFVDTFNEYLDLEFRVGKSYENTHIHLFYLYVYPIFEGRTIDSIKAIDLMMIELILRLRTIEDYSINFFYNTTFKFYDYAIRNGYCHDKTKDHIKNQMKELKKEFLNQKKPKKKQENNSKDKKVILTKDELFFISRYIRGHKAEGIIGLLMIYGFRIGEVLGLRYDSIDFDNRILTISSQVSSRTYLDHTKTRFIRKVMISKSGEYYLNLLMKQNKKLALTNPSYFNPYNLLITSETGGILPFTSLVNYLKEIGKVLNKPSLSFHIFRHTYVTIASELNASLVRTKEEVGHQSILTTMNTYIHETKEAQIRTQDLVNDYIEKLMGERLDILPVQMIDNVIIVKEDSLIEKMTFERYALLYLEKIREQELNEKAILKAVKPYFLYFGAKPIDEIKEIDILKANREFFKNKIKNKTINYRLWGLKKVFEQAKQDYLIMANPALSIDPLKQQLFLKPYYHDEEIKKILIGAKNAKYGNIFTLSLVTGIEAKYLLALNCDDVFLETSTIIINKYIEREKRENIKLIYLNNDYNYYINKKGLEAIKQELLSLKEAGVDITSSAPLFLNQNKKRVSVDNYRDVFKRFSLKNNISYYPVDSLIFSFGIMAYKSDAPVSEVLKNVGKTKGKMIYENKTMYEKFQEKEVNINHFFDDLLKIEELIK